MTPRSPVQINKASFKEWMTATLSVIKTDTLSVTKTDILLQRKDGCK